VNTPFNCPATGQYNGIITIASSPKIRVVADSVFCGTASVVFEGQWLNPDTTVLTWDWDFGNGKTGTGFKPAPVDFKTAGTYKIITTATNNFGCKDIVSRNVLVNDLPRVNIDALSRSAFCDSATIQFRETTVVNGTPDSWLWNFGDGTTSSERTPLHTFTRPGIYNISLQVGTTSNCSTVSRLSGPVVISQTPQIKVPGDTVFCIPNGVYFGAEWLNADTSSMVWAWNFGNGTVSSSQFPGIVRYDKPGSFTATVRAENVYGCWSSLSRIITARDTPNLKISGNTITCLGQGVPLTASGADSYRWEPQVSLSCYNCPNPVANPVATQVYKVTGSNGTGVGCERSKSITVGIIQPRRVIASRGDSICIGESFQLMASGLDKYSWSPAAGLSATNIPNPLARPQQTTVYRLVGTDSLNCFSDTAYIPVAVYNKPTINILKDKITGLAGTRIILETRSTEATRWRWSPSLGLNCVTCPEPEFTISQKITYKVMVTNPGGCEAEDEVAIEPICSTEDIFVPNTFSPNGDGRNDLFYPMGRGVSVIKSLRVYNRWGEAVFERQNFNPNDPSVAWDGTFKGRPLSPDVYVYVMIVLCYNNESIEMKGNVTLLK
jgi:gliding motility-associated-like protein